MSPALAGRFLSPAPPGKSSFSSFLMILVFQYMCDWGMVESVYSFVLNASIPHLMVDFSLAISNHMLLIWLDFFFFNFLKSLFTSILFRLRVFYLVNRFCFVLALCPCYCFSAFLRYSLLLLSPLLISVLLQKNSSPRCSTKSSQIFWVSWIFLIMTAFHCFLFKRGGFLTGEFLWRQRLYLVCPSFVFGPRVVLKS